MHPLLKDFDRIFLDCNRDGWIDCVDLQIHLSPSCTHPEVLRAVMDLSASIGFETMGLNLPLIIGEDREGDPLFKNHLYIGLNREFKTIPSKGNLYFLNEMDVLSLSNSIKNLSFSLVSRNGKMYKKRAPKRFKKRESFDLIRPFSIDGFFISDPRKPWLVSFPYRILIFSPLELPTVTKAGNFVARLGLETPQLSLPLTFTIHSKPKKNPLIYIGKTEDLKRLRQKRFDYLNPYKWDGAIFLLPSRKEFTEILICGSEEGLQRMLKYLSTLPTHSREVKDSLFKEIKRFKEVLEGLLSNFSYPVSASEKIVKEFLIQDERMEMIKLIKEWLKEIPSKMKCLEISALVARPKRERGLTPDPIHRLQGPS